jgi:hypothetical protein
VTLLSFILNLLSLLIQARIETLKEKRSQEERLKQFSELVQTALENTLKEQQKELGKIHELETQVNQELIDFQASKNSIGKGKDKPI